MTSVINRSTKLELPLSKRNDPRSDTRYSLRAVLRYRIAKGVFDSRWRRGQAVNMSAGGILIDIPEALPVGMKLEIVMDWTGLYHGREKMQLFLSGAVTRVDGRKIALRILNHRFRDIHAAVSRDLRRAS